MCEQVVRQPSSAIDGSRVAVSSTKSWKLCLSQQAGRGRLEDRFARICAASAA